MILRHWSPARNDSRPAAADRRLGSRFPGRLLAFLLLVLPCTLALRGAAQTAPAFDAANKLYEQGRYPEAAQAYEKIIQSGVRSGTLYFNLGNAWYKAGQPGRAIAAWRLGENITPRDPSLRFNLQFARRKVSGADTTPLATWDEALQSLSLNEWTLIATGMLWLWCLLLALRELRPALRPALRGYTATAGAAACVLAATLAAAAHRQLHQTFAVISVPEAIVRSGPLEEAKVLHHLRDGVELTVVDRKDVSVGGRDQTWLQVRSHSGLQGWLRNDQVVVIQPARL